MITLICFPKSKAYVGVCIRSWDCLYTSSNRSRLLDGDSVLRTEEDGGLLISDDGHVHHSLVRSWPRGLALVTYTYPYLHSRKRKLQFVHFLYMFYNLNKYYTCLKYIKAKASIFDITQIIHVLWRIGTASFLAVISAGACTYCKLGLACLGGRLTKRNCSWTGNLEIL